MGLLESFKGFVIRVKKAVKGKLSVSDTLLLEHLLNRTNERNLILARGLLTALDIHSPKKSDIQLLAKILNNANLRIIKNKKPFTKEEEKTISKIFLKYGLSQKVADWMSAQRDIFLYNQIEIMAKESTMKKPKTKLVKLEKRQKKKQLQGR